MSTRRAQSGFTLVEVVVAFVIFAITSSAIYEVMYGALRRSGRNKQEIEAWLVAQSLRDERSALPPPWPEVSVGEVSGGWQWRITSTPANMDESATAGLSVSAITIEVRRGEGGPPLASLRSIEVTGQ